MGNPTTVAQWQQAKAALITQSEQLTAQYATLRQQSTQLAFQSADLNKQLKTTTDPVQRAQLQSQLDTVQTQLQQTNTKIDETQTQQAAIGDQISTANDEINRASSGAPNTNTTTDPANNNPGSNTQAAPLQEPVNVAVQYSVPPQLRVQISPIGAGQFSYDIVDTERGKIIQSFDSQAEANAYVAQQGATPGVTLTPQEQLAALKSAQIEANGGVDPSAGDPALEAQLTRINTNREQVNYDTPPTTTGPVPIVTQDQINKPIEQPNPNEYAAETNRLAAQNQAAAQAAENASETARLAARGVSAAKSSTQSTATNQDAVSFQKAKDWRVRLSLAPSAKYLYNATDPGILKPLAATNGVIFPYTPSINVVYSAAYDASELVHSNYKIYNYKNSSVDTVNITCDFTAQDTTEANYLLAVIHFFRSVTKMFYGRDENPRNGVPPPLCYLSGLGAFQFDNHPLAVSNFTYTLPTDVDYIRVGSTTTEPGNSKAGTVSPTNTNTASLARILSSNLGAKTPNFQRQAATINSNATYVPTKMQIAITCIPIVTRNDISNTFSLKEYATGALLQGSKRNGGGIW